MREDLKIIFEMIKPNSRVLDLGCGNGVLLEELIEKKNINGLGIEISLEKIKACLEKGVSVIQEDLNEGLRDFQDNSFDYVILSLTLEEISRPKYLITEMIRVGKKCIISFENFAYWKNRIMFLLTGIPVINLESNNNNNYYRKRQIISIKSFINFCNRYNFNISSKIFLPVRKLHLSAIFPNIFSKIAIFILEK
ncbi:MAG: methionine biosynthesis protein MetW [Promethearchaeia archaeon]